MAYLIISDCNSCGACEPECPNSAISMGDDFYIIRTESCTECVGFHNAPQCAAACPVDACEPDADHVETEAALIEKAQRLHPDENYSGKIPSHFRV